MYKPRRWSIMVANIALVVQTIAPVLLAPVHVSAAPPPSLLFTGAARYVRINNSGDIDAQVQVTDTANQIDFYLNGSPTPVASTTTVIAGAPSGYEWYRLKTPLPAGAYTITAIATLSGDPTPLLSSNTGTVYSIDLPTAQYISPVSTNRVFRSSDNPVRLKVEDEFDQFDRVIFTIKNSLNVVVGTHTVNRASCDLREAGQYLLCDVNDSSTWATLPDGTYTVSAQTYTKANNRLDNFAASTSFTVDNTRPTVNSFTIDTPLSIYRNPIAVSALASDANGIDSVDFYLTAPESRPGGPVCTGNGTQLQNYVVTTPGLDSAYHATFATSGLNGLYCLNAIAADLGSSHSQPVSTIMAQIDTEAPATTITSPLDNPTPTRFPIALAGTSTDNVAVASVTITDTTHSLPITTLINPTPGTSWNWAYNWTPPTEGTYNIQAVTTDTAGNQDAGDTVVNVTYDITPPVLGVITPIASYTNDTTPSFSFSSTEAGAISYGGGCASATTTATVGQTDITLSSLADGQYSSCGLTVTDSAGNVSTVLSLGTFTIDTVNPITTVSSPTASSIWHSPIAISGNSSDVVGLENIVLDYTSGALPWSNITTLNRHGLVSTAWSYDWTPSVDGTYRLRVTTLDLAGNVISETITPVIYDVSGPTGSIVAPTTGLIQTGNFTVSGTADDNLSGVGGIALQFSGQSMINLDLLTEYAQPNWQHTITTSQLPDGVYSLTLTIADNATNLSSFSITNFTFDNTAPNVAITSHFPSTIYNATTWATIAGTTSDATSGVARLEVSYSSDDGVTWSPIETINNPGASWNLSTHWTPTDGEYDLRAIATDRAGLENTSVIEDVVLDTIAPDVAVTNPAPGLVHGTVNILGSVTDANPHHYYFVIKNSSNAPVAGPWTINDSNSFTDRSLIKWNTTLVPDGSYTIVLQARDAANNKDSGSSTSVNVIVDNTSPTLTSLSASSDNTGSSSIARVGNTVTVSFTSSESLSGNPTVSIGGQPLAISGHSGLTYTYTRQIDGTETEGVYSPIVISGSDIVGNTFTATTDFNLDFRVPETTISTPSTSVFVNRPIVIRGQSIDAVGVASVRLSYRQTGTVDWFPITDVVNDTLSGSFNWSYTWTPGENTYDIMAAATDTAGNVEHSAFVYWITYDKTAPTVTNFQILKDGAAVTELVPGDVVTLRVEIKDANGINSFGSVLENATDGKALANITLSLTSGGVYQTSFTVPSTYLDGTALSTNNRWAVGATDKAGNSTSKWSDFTLKITSPSTGATGSTVGTVTSDTGEAVTTELASTPPAESTSPTGNSQTGNTEGNQEVAGASTEKDSLWQSWWFWVMLILIGGGAYYFIWMRPEPEQS